MKLLLALNLAILIASVVCPPPITKISTGGAGGETVTAGPTGGSSLPTGSSSMQPPRPSEETEETTTDMQMSTTGSDDGDAGDGGEGPFLYLISMVLDYFRKIIEAILGVFGSLFGM